MGITGELGSMDVGHSGLELYGVAFNADTSTGFIVVASSLDEPFSEPSLVGSREPGGLAGLTPAISADCRMLYYLGSTSPPWVVSSVQR
jgi:hypothetical protein